METRVVVGLPSYNEADSISHVVKQIDAGICLFQPEEWVLLNVDSGSTDGTREVFHKTLTRCRKKSINTGPYKRGKGKNLLDLFRRASQMKAEYVLTFDTDLTSIEPEWVCKMLSPLVARQCDYVFPLYSRSRFEGSTTNHFAVPLIHALFGILVRQPIGGEFAFTHRVAEHFVSQSFSIQAQKYGIDISMACHALGGEFQVGEVFLGKKTHKPSFPKIVPMFAQVSQAAFECVRLYRLPQEGRYANLNPELRIGIDEHGVFPHKTKIPALLEEVSRLFSDGEANTRIILSDHFPLVKNLLNEKQPELGMEDWVKILQRFLMYALRTPYSDPILPQLGQLLTPIFILRAITFWLASESLTIQEVETEVLTQAHALRETMLEEK